MTRYINWLLAFVPVSLILHMLDAPDVYVFVVSALGIIPLAGLMGRSTEHLSAITGPGIGSLINATFGNATELIIAVMALRQGMVEIVRASISGAIIGNVLFVTGAALVVGGLRKKDIVFNPQSIGMVTALLSLASIAMIVPGILKFTTPGVTEPQLNALSIAVSLVLFSCYVGYLYFSLKTHQHLFDPEQDEEHGGWSVTKAVGILLATTLVIAVLAEILVDSIGPVAKSLGMSNAFMGVFLLALIGNAAEFGSVMTAASKGKVTLALQLALGSSAQIVLLVMPLLVFMSYLWLPMSLSFDSLQLVGVVIAVASTQILLIDGKSHWMEGILLIGIYFVLGIAFYFHP